MSRLQAVGTRPLLTDAEILALGGRLRPSLRALRHAFGLFCADRDRVDTFAIGFGVFACLLVATGVVSP